MRIDDTASLYRQHRSAAICVTAMLVAGLATAGPAQAQARSGAPCAMAPAGFPVDARGCEFDADGDGVVDRLDECPETRAGAPVTMRGCEHDSDGDGVADHRDRCEDTLETTRLTAHGCPLGDLLVLEGVVFESGSARFGPGSTAALEDTVETLLRNPDLHVEIAGHTDSRGEAEDNLRLSRERADAVRRYLVSRGIEETRLTARGYGETQPVADNDHVAGRSRNRRVELRVLSGG